MNRNRLGTSDLSLSVLGLGCAQFGRDPRAWGLVDDNESIGTIHAALDVGINWFDTAPSFGAGHSEEVVGKALQDRRDAALIVTKCGLPLRAPAGGERDLHRKSIVSECEASLRRLRTDYIDLYLCECPDPQTPIEQTIEAMSLLLSQGKVRAVGAVEFGCDLLTAWRASLGASGPHAIMPRLNVLEPESQRDLLPYAVQHGIGFVACSPLCRGLLSGRYSPLSRFSDVRARDRQFAAPRFGQNLRAAEALSAIAARRSRLVAQLAIGWVLAQPGVTATVVGAKRPSQIRSLAGAAEYALRAEELSDIQSIIATRSERFANLP